jgi:peptidyl-tRNA hydrolase
MSDPPFAARAPDRDAVSPMVLPLVVRIERATPPTRTDALEAAAQAVLRLLTDPRSEREWADAVRTWETGRIRKVVRRARGAEWQRAVALPGLTVARRTAEVRVFPPVQLHGWPPDLARLQVSGTDLTDPDDAQAGTAAMAAPSAPNPAGPVLWLAPDLEMTAGKAMAQVGHGAQLGWWALGPPARAAWASTGFELAVRTATAPQWAGLRDAGLPVVRDAGFTEIAAGATTVVADLPWLRR